MIRVEAMLLSYRLKVFSCFLLLGFPVIVYSQKNDSIKESDKMFAFSCGINFPIQKQAMGEIGIMYYKDLGEGPCNPGIVLGPKVSSEFNFRFNQFVIGPKISYEADLWFLGIRFNVIDYTNFKKNDFRFTPEIGLTFLGDLDLFYGYNILLSSTKFDFIGTNRVTLTINILPQK